ncbi:hypothetical protein CCACVL1_17467, partial [Corchorus capsularis]
MASIVSGRFGLGFQINCITRLHPLLPKTYFGVFGNAGVKHY